MIRSEFRVPQKSRLGTPRRESLRWMCEWLIQPGGPVMFSPLGLSQWFNGFCTTPNSREIRVEQKPLNHRRKVIRIDTTFGPRAIPGQVRMPPAVRPISARVPFAASLNSLSISLSGRRGDSELRETANVRSGDALQGTCLEQGRDRRVVSRPPTQGRWRNNHTPGGPAHQLLS